MKRVLLTFCILAGMLFALTVDARQVRVRGYRKKDGTYVSPHVRNVGGRSKSSSSYRTRSSSSNSYRTRSRSSHASSYGTHSYNTSVPSWQPPETQDNGTFPSGVKEQEGSKQDEVFLSEEMAKNGNAIDEEKKREEVEKKRQEAARRKQEAIKQQQEAARQYREEAEMGNVKAQFKLAWCYEKGVGVKKDMEAAVRWYRKAAAQGDVAAQTALVRLGKR